MDAARLREAIRLAEEAWDIVRELRAESGSYPVAERHLWDAAGELNAAGSNLYRAAVALALHGVGSIRDLMRRVGE